MTEPEGGGPRPTHRKRRIPAEAAAAAAEEAPSGYGATNVPTPVAPFARPAADPEAEVATDEDAIGWTVVLETTSAGRLRDAFDLLADEGFTARTRVVSEVRLSTGAVDTGQLLVAAGEADRARRVLDSVGDRGEWDPIVRYGPPWEGGPEPSVRGWDGLSTGVLILAALVVVAFVLVAVL